MAVATFTPRISYRGTTGYAFYELFLAWGPQSIGDAGEGEIVDIAGRQYALVVDSATHALLLYRQSETTLGSWEEVTANLPPIFGEVQPSTRRRFSVAFDQSARVIVAYEESEIVYVTRWDEDTEAYKQNVSFSGTDPVLLLDALVFGEVPGSDVLLFYTDPAAPGDIYCRVQREQYGTPRLIYSQAEPLILDRAQALGYRYQLLISDEAGDHDGTGLISDTYPARMEDPLSTTALFKDALWSHYRNLYDQNPVDALDTSALFLDGIYTAMYAFFTAEPLIDEVDVDALFSDGIYTALLEFFFSTLPPDVIDATALFLDGEYRHFRDLYDQYPVDVLDATAQFSGGEYREI